MECPTCGVELIDHDYYGKTDHNTMSGIRKIGDIYKCPNSEGFEEKEDAIAYAKDNGIEYEDDNWEDIVCESAVDNGFFHTDRNDNLKEGYPC